MDENVPTRSNVQMPSGRNTEMPSGSSRHHINNKKPTFKKIGMVIGLFLILTSLTLGGLFLWQSTTSSAIDGSKYQAVFLTNGQVYFGKLQMLNGGYMKLTDIYYLQASTTSPDASIQDSSNSSSDVQLIKLGSEIHGPNDEMVISKDQILFFENIKKDGKVAESIAKYQQSKK